MPERNSIDRSRPSSEIATSPVIPHTGPSGFDGHDSLEGSANNDRKEFLKDANQNSAIYDSVVQSDIGVNTLLTRLKQSVASARDFAAFLKKRSTIEEDHAQALKKLTRSAFESTRRPDSRQGSYARNYEGITNIHDRVADNGIQFALSLHQMHEDLTELSVEKEKGRKLWKQNGLSAEKRVQDAEAAMEKAKAKYNTLAEDYDRARTGDKQSGRFGLKGPKSAAQVEEDLQRKTQAADVDYSSKVQTAQAMRQDLLSTLRPQAVRALEALINECDSGLTLQMQKFATFNEKLLLGNGLCINPLEETNGSGQTTRSLRDVVSQIDNEQDLKMFVTSFSSKVGPKQHDLEYRRHPTQHVVSNSQPTIQSAGTSGRPHVQISSTQPLPFVPPNVSSAQSHAPASQAPGVHSNFGTTASGPSSSIHPEPLQQQTSLDSPLNASQLNPPISSYHQPSSLGANYGTSSLSKASESGNSNPAPGGSAFNVSKSPSTKPVFGVSLEHLFQRDGSAVPMVVYQCLQAVEIFGLDVEGIYRLSGTASHISQLRAMFDHDASLVDFRNPESFMHDVNSVAGLLKQFFRDLPDPLFTKEHYQSFIDAARIDDDITRRDSLHATINSLPDPNYATLRALTLHLHRVQEHSNTNRMTSANLAICFGPTLMVSGSPPAIADAGWQVRVIDTILQNTFQIFDDD